MRNKLILFMMVVAWGAEVAGWAKGSSFTYQGHLKSGGSPVNGNYDMRFSLWDAVTNGNQLSGILIKAPVTVTDGLFTVMLDFGAEVFDGSARWLEIGVWRHEDGGDYAVLNPRQSITAAPYALMAGGASFATVASALADGGASLTNLSGASIQPGTISSNQIDAATDAVYRQPLNAVTNNFGQPLIVGNSRGAHFNCQACSWTNTPAASYTNLLLGVDHQLPWVLGSSILVPDRGGMFWADGSGIYGWNDHSETLFGGGANELQILGNTQMALACYNAAYADGGFQMGGSGGFHDKFWFQYDTDSAIPGLGFSKLVQFVTRSGPNNTYAYSAIRAVAADTFSGRNTLNFYSGTPSAIDNSGGNRVGTMLTDGWDFRGRLVTEHVIYDSDATNVIDWLRPSSSEFRIQGNSATFITANLPSGTTNNESRVVFIKSGAFAPTLTFPQGWHWLNEAGNAVAPANLAAARILKLTLTALGPGDGNVLAEAKVGVFP
jgi:hypothetical protein